MRRHSEALKLLLLPLSEQGKIQGRILPLGRTRTADAPKLQTFQAFACFLMTSEAPK
jgi:hypothetical protein